MFKAVLLIQYVADLSPRSIPMLARLVLMLMTTFLIPFSISGSSVWAR